MATWCFFLVSALFVAIPTSMKAKRGQCQDVPAENEKFDRARRQADQALQQLFTQ